MQSKSQTGFPSAPVGKEKEEGRGSVLARRLRGEEGVGSKGERGMREEEELLIAL